MNESIRKQSVPRPARHATLCQSTSASTVGHTFGLPEESPCCACHEGDVAKRLRASNSHVRHALFFATHVMDDPDTALVRDYVLDLAQQKSAAKLSVLYYRPATSPQPMSTGEVGDFRRVARLTGTSLFVWSEDDLFTLFPPLERSLSKSASLAQTPRAVCIMMSLCVCVLCRCRPTHSLPSACLGSSSGTFSSMRAFCCGTRLGATSTHSSNTFGASSQMRSTRAASRGVTPSCHPPTFDHQCGLCVLLQLL